VTARTDLDGDGGVVKADSLKALLAPDSQRVDALGEIAGQGLGAVGLGARLLELLDHVGQAQAVGREDAGEAVDEHAAHTQHARDGARVLSAGSAEARQHVLGLCAQSERRESPRYNLGRHGR
jgi:hypothetical protein